MFTENNDSPPLSQIGKTITFWVFSSEVRSKFSPSVGSYQSELQLPWHDKLRYWNPWSQSAAARVARNTAPVTVW